MKKNLKALFVGLAASLLIAGCGNSSGGQSESSQASSASSSSAEKQEVKIGVVGDNDREVWEGVKKSFEAKHPNVTLDIQVFTDYVTPNTALQDGSLDMNAFQHMAFLKDFDDQNKGDLVPIAYTYISAMAAYSNSVKDLKDLPNGAKVAIPNDPTNGGRALLLLEQAGIIKVDKNAGITPGVDDVTDNPKNLKFVELDAAQVPAALKDSDAVIANTNYAVAAGLDPYKDGIYVDTDKMDKVGNQYKNVVAVKEKNKDNKLYKEIAKAYQTQQTADKLSELSGGADKKAWSDNDDPEADFKAFKVTKRK